MSVCKQFRKNQLNLLHHVVRERFAFLKQQLLKLLTANRPKLTTYKRRSDMRQVNAFVPVKAAVLNRVLLESIQPAFRIIAEQHLFTLCNAFCRVLFQFAQLALCFGFALSVHNTRFEHIHALILCYPAAVFSLVYTALSILSFWFLYCCNHRLLLVFVTVMAQPTTLLLYHINHKIVSDIFTLHSAAGSILRSYSYTCRLTYDTSHPNLIPPVGSILFRCSRHAGS